jgi:hypothetical protein
MKNVAELLENLAAKQFDALVGVSESAWLDAKESPYFLDGLKQKLELAKDVSALANSIGGIIVLGFATTRDSLTAGERISEVKPFPLDMVNSDRSRKVIQEYVHRRLMWRSPCMSRRTATAWQQSSFTRAQVSRTASPR